MKTLSFFNEKGGVGKSSFTLLWASWLKYKHGVNVGVADFNRRLAKTRENEENFCIQGNIPIASLDERWPIEFPSNDELRRYKDKNLPPYGKWFYDQLTKGPLKDCELVIADFPGALTGDELIQVLEQKLLSYVVIPTDRNNQTISCTSLTARILARSKVPHSIFINQVSHQVDKKIYVKIQKFIQERMGEKVLPDLISYTERMRKLGGKDSICRTLSFPDWEQPEFRGSRDLGIENLFIDVTRELKKQPELPIGNHCDLSFVDELEKKNDFSAMKRQLSGTAFPEYEIQKED